MADDFDRFLDQRQRAASAYVAGDGRPVDEIAPHTGAATFHSPGGETVTGAEAVARRYLADAKLFRPGGTSRFEILQKGSDGAVGFWTGYQIAKAQIGDMPQPADMRLRVTEVFRKIDGRWLMVHRHADMGGAKSK